MHQISMNVGNIVWALLFKTEEKALAAWEHYMNRDSDTVLRIEDDFGQTLDARPAIVNGAMLENLDLTKHAHIERALHQARTQAEAQAAGEADMALRAQRRGPAILQPIGMNGRG
jgi:hypothetical protein